MPGADGMTKRSEVLPVTTLSLRLPESIHRQLVEVARQEGVSINQLITLAVGQKLSALMTESYLAERAARGSRKKFDAVLAKVPKAAPIAEDSL